MAEGHRHPSLLPTSQEKTIAGSWLLPAINSLRLSVTEFGFVTEGRPAGPGRPELPIPRAVGKAIGGNKVRISTVCDEAGGGINRLKNRSGKCEGGGGSMG